MSFVHLHSHTHFSLGEGVSSPEAMLEAAAARGFTALACTDTNGVYGAVEFQQAAESMGIRPILGAHLKSGGEETVALAEDERGWAALCRAITEIHWGGQGGRGAGGDTFSLSTHLAADRAGLILLSSDPSFLERIHRLSGPADLYAELRPGKERHAVLAAARQLGIPSVVTGAVMFAHAEDWSRHRLRVAIHHNTTLGALDQARADDVRAGPRAGDVWAGPRAGDVRAGPRAADVRAGPRAGDVRAGPRAGQVRADLRSAPTKWPAHPSARDAWLRPGPELARHFPDCPEALTATEAIAERCRYRIPIGRTVAPRVADHAGALDHLRALAYEGALRRYGTIAPLTRDRLEHELAIIGTKNFADYFLVVHDIVQNGPTHCGRGSVANSIVSYCLGITHVEPLGAGLLFERFLNPERRDPPDIDLDFPWDERDQILAYVFRRYPRPLAAMVANHNTFRLRGALREVAKVHGRPPGEIREVTRRIPWYSDDVPLSELLATHPNFQGLDLPDAWRNYAALAAPLVGTPRHLSLHPGGVVIVPSALTDYVPLEPAAKALDGHPDLTVPVIQFEKDGAEDAGLVKIDLLGNRSLAVIRDAIAAVAAHTGRQIDYTRADPEDDEPTKALFRTGQTMGVFYTESPASRLLCAKSRADTFELLVLNTSIIRPASNRFIRQYLERLHGGAWEPLDPCLRDTLAETFGVMVYQEDVVNVCAAFAGMPLATGDGLRKALSKKRPVKQLAAYAEEFFAGAERLGRDFERAKKVWEMVMSFAGYSFCKGHSCSYIRVAQHSCYLRANYPAEFIAAVLANGGGFYAPFAYVAEAMRMGLTVRPPDVNASQFRCAGQDKELRIGFQFIKGLSQTGVDRLLEARQTGPSFSSPAELRSRAGLTGDDLRILIKAGACDSIAGGMSRPMMLWEVDGEGQTGPKGLPRGGGANSRAPMPLGRRGAEGQLVPAAAPVAVPLLREYTTERRRVAEYEALGFTTDSHPMRLFADRLRRFRTCPSTELHRHVGQSVVVAGMLTTSKPVHTAKEEPMEFATFDDGDGLIETVLFPDVYRKRGHVLFDQGPFLIRGLVEEEFGAITLTVQQIERLERVGSRKSRV